MKKNVSCAALSLVTLVSLAVRAQGLQAPAAVLADGAVWALGAGALWMFYRAWLSVNHPLGPVRLWILSALFAGVITLGQSFSVLGTAEWVTGHPLAALLFFAGRVPLYLAGMRLLLHLLSRKSAAVRPMAGWKLGALLWLCWLPWYICLFPGTVSVDSISMLMITYGLKPLTNANPAAQTGLLWLFRKIGEITGGGADLSVALYCIIQSGLMAWLLGSLMNEMAKSRAPRGLVWISFAFYALCPVFPVFAFCVGKDTNFAMAVLWLSLESWRISHSEKASPARFISVSLAAVACVLLRNPGIYLALLTLILLLAWCLCRKHSWAVPAVGIASAAGVFLILHLAILPALNMQPMPETEEYSVPLQQVARVAASASFTPEQAEALDGVLHLDELARAYKPELSDPVKNLWREDATEQQKAAFWKAWLSILKDNPLTCASATFHNTYAYLYPGYVSTIKPTLLMGDHTSRTASVVGFFDFSVNPLSAPLEAFTQVLNQNVLYRLLVSPGLYGWISLFAVVWLMGCRDRRGLLASVPALFTLAGCMLSAVNGYFRYAMPLYISAPLLLWMVAQNMQKAEGGSASPCTPTA